MHTQFFGLKRRPFGLTSDPEFLFLSRVHDLALTHLEYGLAHNLGFMALTGGVGTGKTILVKHLLEKVRDSFHVAMIFNTFLDAETLLAVLVREFELTPRSQRKSDLFEALFRHFMDLYAAGMRCAIVVDEAQNLSGEAFEELRMLSNLEVGQDFLLQIILAGQPQLRTRLSDPSLVQLAQRISVHFHLVPLSQAEVGDYIRHRMRVAGYGDEEPPVFGEDAVQAVFRMSRGIPRLINSVCDAALSFAYAEGVRRVDGEKVDAVSAEGGFSGTGAAAAEEAAEGGSGGLPGWLPVTVAADGTPPWGEAALLRDMERRLSALEKRLASLGANGSGVRGGEDTDGGRVSSVPEVQGETMERGGWENALKALRLDYMELNAQLEALRRTLASRESRGRFKRLWRLINGGQ